MNEHGRMLSKLPATLSLSFALACMPNLGGAEILPFYGFYQADATVRAAAISGNTLYIAGEFNEVGRPVGGFVGLNPITAQPAVFPEVGGIVNAIAPDGSGGWYIG